MPPLKHVRAGLLSLVLVSGCYANKENVVQPLTSGRTMTLRTSFYGTKDGFAGRKTASGELFDPNALACAHRSLPFGTLLRVSNPGNGRSVTVRVNDRGPFVKGRELDLSVAAAREVGMRNDGVQTLVVEILQRR